MKKITLEQLEKSSHRKDALRSRLLELEENVSGYGINYLPIILGESGKTDPEKLDKFIGGLIESFKDYSELFPERKIKPEMLEMYRKFLYIALSTVICREKYGVREKNYPETFGDIIEAAKGVDIKGCENYRDFLELQYGLQIDPNGDINSEFFSMVHETMQLMAMDYVDELPRETRIGLCVEYARKNGISEKDNRPDLLRAKNPSAYFKMIGEYAEEKLADCNETEEERQAIINKMAEDYEKEQNEKQPYLDAVRSLGDKHYTENELLKNLSETERKHYKYEASFDDYIENVIPFLLDNLIIEPLEYFKNLDKFAKLYFDSFRPECSNGVFFEDIKNMVETYLYEHGISAFSFGDYYGLIMHQVKRAKKRVEYEIERVKNKYDL